MAHRNLTPEEVQRICARLEQMGVPFHVVEERYGFGINYQRPHDGAWVHLARPGDVVRVLRHGA